MVATRAQRGIWMTLIEEVTEWWDWSVDLSFLCEFSLEITVLFVKIEHALSKIVQSIVDVADPFFQFGVAYIPR